MSWIIAELRKIVGVELQRYLATPLHRCVVHSKLDMEETSDVHRENAFVNYVENFLYQLYSHWKSQRNCESCNAFAMAVGIEEIIYKKAYSENQIMNQMNSIPLWKKTDVLAWYKRQCELILRNFENAKVTVCI